MNLKQMGRVGRCMLKNSISVKHEAKDNASINLTKHFFLTFPSHFFSFT